MYIIWPFQNDEHWKKNLKETIVSRLACQTRQLFAIMLTACKIEQSHPLLGKFKNNMSEDFLNKARLQNENMSIEFCLGIYNQCLSDLSCQFQDLNSTLTNYGMPEPDVRMELHYEIYQKTNYDTYILFLFINEYEFRLVDD